MTTKTLSAWVVETKTGGAGGWTAIASTPVIDHDGESLAKGCFLPLPPSVPVHVDHSLKVEDCVGRARPYYSGESLMLDGTFASTDKAQHVRQLVIEGIVDSMSVVFIDPVRKNIDGIQTVTKGTLKAVDWVTIGANPEARLVSARAWDPGRRASGGDLRVEAFKAQLALLEADLATLGSPPPPTMSDTEIRAALRDAEAFLDDLRRPPR
jgi:hypothetical protein